MRVEERRNDDGSLDEVLLYDDADDCVFHLEQMSPRFWYFGLYPSGVDERLEQYAIERDKKRVIVRNYRDPVR